MGEKEGREAGRQEGRKAGGQEGRKEHEESKEYSREREELSGRHEGKSGSKQEMKGASSCFRLLVNSNLKGPVFFELAAVQQPQTELKRKQAG